MKLATETGTLSALPPFDFGKSLAFLGGFSPMSEEQVITSTMLTKALKIEGHTVAFRLSSAGTPERVAYTLFSEQPLPARKAVTDRISFFLSLQDDLKPFYAIAQEDVHFAPIIDELYGLHQVKFPTLCEAACWAVLSQHTAIPIARKMKRAIMERYGSSIELDGHVYHAYPELDDIAGISLPELTRLINNELRAYYLSEVIRGLAEIDENFLRTAPYEEAEARLREIKGIGEWSAGLILLRCEGRMEKVMFDMKPFMHALQKVYGTTDVKEEIIRRYGQWVGYWGYYLRAGA
jgi:DNA-3-methyladenine glycosylase II